MKQIEVYDDCMNENDISLAGLDLNLITALHALLDRQSVSDAAAAVGRTQSAMSHSLSRLRAHFRDPILVREGWSMQLTPFAADLQPRVLAAAQAAKLMFATTFAFDPATTTRRIRIAAPDLCTTLFTGLVRELSDQAPHASVEFTHSGAARQTVLRSEAEIGLGFGRPKSDPNLVLHRIAPLQWCTFAPTAHDYCTDPNVTTWSRSRHILVGQGGPQEGPVEKMLRKQKINRHVVSYAPNFSAALMLAAETGALFTTLRAPFEKLALRLGMTPMPLPFEMPDAPATLMFRVDYGDPFSIWLREMCLNVVGLTNGQPTRRRAG